MSAERPTDVLLERYLRHVALAATGVDYAWHVCVARGLYRLMADRELAGGDPAPMGMPHMLCITDDECRSLR